VKTLRDILGEDRYSAFWNKPSLFVKAFDREPWPYQEQALNKSLARTEAGKFLKPIIILSYPRQDSKTTLSVWADLWRLYLDPDPQEIVSVANDKEQARIKLNDARRIIRNSEILYSLIDGRHGLTRSEIRLKNGNRWLIKSADSVFSRGLRPSTVSYDELGWAVSRELFDTLSAGQAAQKNPLTFVTSTVGPVKAGILWELFELARAGNSSIYLDYRTENLSPLVTKEYLDRERALLPANIYAREHMNLWGEGSDAFCTEEDWQRAIANGDPRRSADEGPSNLFCDLGWVHDETALAVAKREKERVKVIGLETFKGTQSHPVQFSAVEGKIIELAGTLNIKRARIESPQGVAMAQRLNVSGLAAEVLHPTARSNQENWGALYTALKNGTVDLPNDAKLRQQLLTLTIVTTQNGWRVEDVPSIHNDRAVAVAGVVAMTAGIQAAHLPEKQPEQPSRWGLHDNSRKHERQGWAKRY
jgi:hypothetical protein